jgi:hypothetical protein
MMNVASRHAVFISSQYTTLSLCSVPYYTVGNHSLSQSNSKCVLDGWAGDVLYIPPWWLHRAEALNESVSVSSWFEDSLTATILEQSAALPLLPMLPQLATDPRTGRIQVRKTPPFEPFMYRNDDFTKTGSGQTLGKLRKEWRQIGLAVRNSQFVLRCHTFL